MNISNGLIDSKNTGRGAKGLEDKDKRMIAEIKDISARGNSAEVKYDKDGKYVIYEIKKKRKQVG